MSAILSAVERTRSAFASLSRLEEELARTPNDRGLQLNLAGCRKIALQYEQQLMAFSGQTKTDICKYRLIPESTDGFALASVADSMGSYQRLFSQIYDAIKNGIRSNVGFGIESFKESTLQVGYTYSGSLGIVLLSGADSSEDLWGGSLNSSVDALFKILEVDSQSELRSIANELGLAVVKRLHAWLKANRRAGFAAEVRWKTSDGKERGEVVDTDRMSSISDLIEATTDETTQQLEVSGRLVGIDLKSRTFRIVAAGGSTFRGALAEDFPVEETVAVNRHYRATLIDTKVIHYAAEKEKHWYQLKTLARHRVANRAK